MASASGAAAWSLVAGPWRLRRVVLTLLTALLGVTESMTGPLPSDAHVEQALRPGDAEQIQQRSLAADDLDDRAAPCRAALEVQQRADRGRVGEVHGGEVDDEAHRARAQRLAARDDETRGGGDVDLAADAARGDRVGGLDLDLPASHAKRQAAGASPLTSSAPMSRKRSPMPVVSTRSRTWPGGQMRIRVWLRRRRRSLARTRAPRPEVSMKVTSLTSTIAACVVVPTSSLRDSASSRVAGRSTSPASRREGRWFIRMRADCSLRSCRIPGRSDPILAVSRRRAAP